MTPARGLTLRYVGLIIEVLCMLGLLSLARGKVDIWKGFPFEPSRFLMVGLGIGFLLWGTGTAVIYSARKRAATEGKRNDEAEATDDDGY